jgi:hypothetical protein
MKFATDRPYANPETAARKLIEIANAVEAVQDGRIYIELINAPFLYEHKAIQGTAASFFPSPFMFLIVSVKTSLATKIKRHFQS